MEADTGGVKGERRVSGQQQPFGWLLTKAGGFNALGTLWNIISPFLKGGQTSFHVTSHHLPDAKQWYLALLEKSN